MAQRAEWGRASCGEREKKAGRHLLGATFQRSLPVVEKNQERGRKWTGEKSEEGGEKKMKWQKWKTKWKMIKYSIVYKIFELNLEW